MTDGLDAPEEDGEILDASMREQAIYWYALVVSPGDLSDEGKKKLGRFLADVANELHTSDPVASTQESS